MKQKKIKEIKNALILSYGTALYLFGCGRFFLTKF